MVRKWLVLLPIIGLMTACATVPTGPTVMVLPGAGKPFDLFQGEDVACRQYAQAQAGTTSGQSVADSAVSGGLLGSLLGAGLGAAIGAIGGRPDVGAAVGAGTGLLIGSSEGARAGTAAGQTVQWRYDVAYVQCMYAKGNQVPGTAPPPSHVPPPPPNAPPPPPASFVPAGPPRSPVL
jgi:hypothetical protein